MSCETPSISLATLCNIVDRRKGSLFHDGLLSVAGLKVKRRSCSELFHYVALIPLHAIIMSLFFSPWPEGNYQFSTLWGGYVEGKAQKFTVSTSLWTIGLFRISFLGQPVIV